MTNVNTNVKFVIKTNKLLYINLKRGTFLIKWTYTNWFFIVKFDRYFDWRKKKLLFKQHEEHWITVNEADTWRHLYLHVLVQICWIFVFDFFSSTLPPLWNFAFFCTTDNKKNSGRSTSAHSRKFQYAWLRMSKIRAPKRSMTYLRY